MAALGEDTGGSIDGLGAEAGDLAKHHGRHLGATATAQQLVHSLVMCSCLCDPQRESWGLAERTLLPHTPHI
jgi:hypothetical protein